MTIRRATKDDLELLRRLWEEFRAGQPDVEHYRETWDESWADIDRNVEDYVTLLAEDEGQAVGFAIARLRSKRIGFVSDLYVRPEARRRGIGRALLAEAGQSLAASGADLLKLSVEAGNVVARTAYRRLGFREESVDLILEIDRLVRPAERQPSFGSTHVQTDDVTGVQRAVAQFVPRLGRSSHSDVSESQNGWVAVHDELCDRDRSAQRRLAAELSDRLGSVVVALALEEGTVVRFLLFERGRMVDEYLSVPTYYGALNKADELSLAANPTLVARLTGADPARVRAVARIASSPSELPPAPELLAQIADVMGLEARIER